MIRSVSLPVLMAFSLAVSAETNLGGDILVKGKVGEIREAGPGEAVYQYMCMGSNGPEKCQLATSAVQQMVIVPAQSIIQLVKELPDSILIEELTRRGFTLKQKGTTLPTVQKEEAPGQK